MTLNETIMQLVMLAEHPAMPKGFQPTLDKIIEALSELEPETHWIPTSKERPPKYKEIWITDVYGDVEVVYRGDGKLWLSNGDNGYYFEDEIIAWMPANVPEPYHPEEESE